MTRSSIDSGSPSLFHCRPDGVHSTTRTLSLGEQPPRYAGQVVWRAVIPTSLGGLDGMQLVMGDGSHVAHSPALVSKKITITVQ